MGHLLLRYGGQEARTVMRNGEGTMRLVHKLDTFTDQQRTAQQRVRGLIWWFYADLRGTGTTRAPGR